MMCVSRFVVGWNGDVECGSMVHALGSFAGEKVSHDAVTWTVKTSIVAVKMRITKT